VWLDETRPDEWMAPVAGETNRSDPLLVMREKLADADFRIRQFTRPLEADLSGFSESARPDRIRVRHSQPRGPVGAAGSNARPLPLRNRSSSFVSATSTGGSLCVAR
jgi:hypothetical protein